MRTLRVAPGLDRKIVTSWNGLAISALAQGHAVTQEVRFLEAARAVADFLLSAHRKDDGSLWRTSSAGRTSGDGILDDYAFLAQGLIELFQVCGELRYLQAARQLTDFALESFARPDGAFYLSAAGVAAPLGRRIEYFDSVEPSGCAVLVDNLVRLGAITGHADYTDRARRELDSVSDLLEKMGLEMACWLDAGRKLVSPYFAVVLAGDDPTMADLLRGKLPANAIVCPVPGPGADQDLKEVAPALAGKTAREDRTTAYVCRFGACNEPTTSAQEVLRMLELN